MGFLAVAGALLITFVAGAILTQNGEENA